MSRLRTNKEIISIGGSLILHPFSTGSHAKIVVADTGSDIEYIAVVGSCNWFSSNFTSYEASVKLRDPQIVRDVVNYIAQLSSIHDGVWSDLASELVTLSRELAAIESHSSTNASVAVVIGAQHEHFVLRARDEANERAFVASHRLGPVSTPSVIVPLMKAVAAKGIQANLYYCRGTGPVRANAEVELVGSASAGGVSVKLLESPRLHAKVLAWDKNALLITSLNWLSADPVATDSLKEIGIWIESSGAATAFISNFTATIEQHLNPEALNAA